MAGSYNFSIDAYCKLLLHVVKYPHRAVNGILIGDQENNGRYNVTDVIPLFHNLIGLTPMLEVAFAQIEAYCRLKNLMIIGYYQANELFTQNGLTLFGAGVGQKILENCSDACIIVAVIVKLGIKYSAFSSPLFWGAADCHKSDDFRFEWKATVRPNFHDNFFGNLMVSNENIVPIPSESAVGPLKLFLPSENRGWKEAGSHKITVDEGAIEKYHMALSDNLDAKIVDFDNYLDSPSLDWLNRQLFHQSSAISEKSPKSSPQRTKVQ